MPAWPERDVRELIARALEEDLGAGDMTTAACVPADAWTRGRFLARQELVLAGIELLPLVYEQELETCQASGTRIAAGEVIASIAGPAHRLLERERVALNFLQHLSGIATYTRRFVDTVVGTGATIRDTRKTTPGLRHLEKRAVLAGGGCNHRAGLYDAVLIKENHIAAAGGVRAAVEATRHVSQSVEVEVRNREELEQALEAGADCVLLDNMTPELVRDSITLVRDSSTLVKHKTVGTEDRTADLPPRRVRVEISGGVTLANVRDYALAGPDYIAVGALTHSAPAVDITFLLESPLESLLESGSRG